MHLHEFTSDLLSNLNTIWDWVRQGIFTFCCSMSNADFCGAMFNELICMSLWKENQITEKIVQMVTLLRVRLIESL